MSAYKYDIFLSHRRTDKNRVQWTREKFLPPLRTFLHENLGKVDIFFDEESIETGEVWPDKLADALASSKILIALLCPNYFYSDWCRLELALMHHRIEKTGCNVIFPLVIEDGDRFEPKVKKMQSKPIHAYSNPWICLHTPKYEEFTDAIRTWVPSIDAAIRGAPPLDPDWKSLNRAEFQDVFEKLSVPNERTVPGIGLKAKVPGAVNA